MYRISDTEIQNLIDKEKFRQESQVMLIASENYVSKDILNAQGSILTNKYAEGYPGKRYYEGCEIVDKIESLAIERFKKLFNVKYVNVQPHSGSQANQGVFTALLNPGDKILSMSMNSGGHLTHGSKASISGKWFDVYNYDVNEEGVLDYDDIEKKAYEFKPKLIICGYSAYSRKLDFKKFREIADKVDAYLLSDIAHIAGIIAYDNICDNFQKHNTKIVDSKAEEITETRLVNKNANNFFARSGHQNPFLYSHVITSTTHKTLRGPRGGIIMTNDENLAKKINSAIFPGIQGGPLMHVIAAKAVSAKENNSYHYVEYIRKTLDNTQFLAKYLKSLDFDLVSGGTDNHLILIDLSRKNITGKDFAHKLATIGIVCNKNCTPRDKLSPMITSGIRIGTPATTTRGFGFEEYKQIADIMKEVYNNDDNFFNKKIDYYKNLIEEICKKFPIYTNL